MKECINCKNFQSYYVRNNGKFFITNFGYCCVYIGTRSATSCCSEFNKNTKKQKLIFPSKKNINNAINSFFSFIENLGIEVEDKDVGKCKPKTDLTPYNSRLE